MHLDSGDEWRYDETILTQAKTFPYPTVLKDANTVRTNILYYISKDADAVRGDL